MTYDENRFFYAVGVRGLPWRGAFTLGAGLEVDRQQMRAQMITICQVRIERARKTDASASGPLSALEARLRRMKAAYKAAARRLMAKGTT